MHFELFTDFFATTQDKQQSKVPSHDNKNIPTTSMKNQKSDHLVEEPLLFLNCVCNLQQRDVNRLYELYIITANSYNINIINSSKR